jgi:hypothetical protein
MEPESDCLVRYGLMGHVGWFALDVELAPGFERGRSVVLRTSRGMELGEVLIGPKGAASDELARRRVAEDSVGPFRVLRFASDDDFALSREVGGLREARFDACRRIVSEAGWPLELIDVEPLLDRTTVLHYVGGDDLDLALVRARFRATCDFDVNFEDLRGDSTATTEQASAVAAPRKGGCGDCDCGAGGCSTAAKRSRETSSDVGAETAHSGCSSCGVAAMLKDRRRQPSASS